MQSCNKMYLVILAWFYVDFVLTRLSRGLPNTYLQYSCWHLLFKKLTLLLLILLWLHLFMTKEGLPKRNADCAGMMGDISLYITLVPKVLWSCLLTFRMLKTFWYFKWILISWFLSRSISLEGVNFYHHCGRISIYTPIH